MINKACTTLITLLPVLAAMGQQGQDTACLLRLPSLTPSVEEIKTEIGNQTAFSVVFDSDQIGLYQLLSFSSLQVSLGTILDKIARQFRSRYEINGLRISFRRLNDRPLSRYARSPAQVMYRVVDSWGMPVEDVTVLDRQSGRRTVSDPNGRFLLPQKPGTRQLLLSHIQFEPTEAFIGFGQSNTIVLKTRINGMDSVVITGYSRDARKTSTSSAFVIRGKDLSPVAGGNILSELVGRASGLQISETNAAAGATQVVLIRGRQYAGEIPGVGNLPQQSPLYTLNLVPLNYGVNAISKVSSIAGHSESDPNYGISFLNDINPEDIERIEVLKDADATAIYGSRGANGVIHFTTYQGYTQKVRFTAKLSSGINRTYQLPRLLNTQQYVAMRRAALQAAGLPVDNSTAPELMSWDTSRYTNFSKLLLGGTAPTHQAYLSASGGGRQLNFYSSAGYREEGSVLPASFGSRQLSLHTNFNYHPIDDFQLQGSFLLGGTRLDLPTEDLRSFLYMAPNAPALRDSAGSLVFEENGLSFANPEATLKNTYRMNTFSMTGGIQLECRLTPRLRFRANLGMNNLQATEFAAYPIAASIPYAGLTGASTAATSNFNSWILEPQLSYRDTGTARAIHYSGILGLTLIGQESSATVNYRTGYTNDVLLLLQEQAPSTKVISDESSYRYMGLFGRISTNLREKWFVNITGRLDGSSRFGPDKQIALYGALGGAWLFYAWKKTDSSSAPFFSYGKLRGSIGTSGSDHTGDYRYFDMWESVNGGSYAGVMPLRPVRLSNPALSWQQTLKTELAYEMKLLDRLSLTAAWYCNRTSRQLIAQNMPGQTGFNSINAVNFAATVQNSGWEIDLQHSVRLGKKTGWNTQLVLSLPRNKLLSFKDLDNSLYKNTLKIGYPMTIQMALVSLGVNTQTGLYEVADLNGDGNISLPEDLAVAGHLDVTLYGSWRNEFRMGQFTLSLLVEGRRQQALSPLFEIYTNTPPGQWNASGHSNQSILVLDRWQKTGDRARLPQWSASTDADVLRSYNLLTASNAMMENAAYLRLRVANIGWQLPPEWADWLRITTGRVYLEGTNLLTITGFKGGDPTLLFTQSLPSMSSLRAGIEITL